MNREKVIANLSAEINRLVNANIRLEEERADIWRRNRDTESSRDTKAAIIAELKAENESLRADAERFRHLMFNHVDWYRNGKDDDAVMLKFGPYPSHKLRETIDATISSPENH